ncbi:MAG: DUF721 domain-containing protein [Muribaculaceae bacterium]|nr:DUF721 domain-containing protein [Muribaculaceae bacterium]
MKRTHPEQIGELVERLIQENGLTDKILAQRASFGWREVVGDGINRYTTRRSVIGTVMHVWLSSAPLKNELLYQREKLVKAINNYLGKEFITEIRFH